MLENIDTIRINFNPDAMIFLNITLAFIMFGIALELKPSNFRDTFRQPKAVVVGLISQLLLLPFITFVLIKLMGPTPSMALGMILVASCPGGNVSNFLSSLSQSNTALSVSLTTVTTVFSFLLTPLAFAFWASLHPETMALLKTISIDPLKVILTVFLILGLPLALGIGFSARFPEITRKIIVPIRRVSIAIFVGFVLVAFLNNFSIFLKVIQYIAFIVLVHNGAALASGYLFARTLALPEKDARAISIETGIQNSGLGLALIFAFFDGLGGMALVAALWGIWHLISGLTLAFYWSRKTDTAGGGLLNEA